MFVIFLLFLELRCFTNRSRKLAVAVAGNEFMPEGDEGCSSQSRSPITNSESGFGGAAPNQIGYDYQQKNKNKNGYLRTGLCLDSSTYMVFIGPMDLLSRDSVNQTRIH